MSSRGDGGLSTVTVEQAVIIRRRPEEIYAALADFGPTSRWYSEVIEEHHHPTGPVAAGTEITQVREEGGRRALTRYRVLQYEPDKLLQLQSIGIRPASTITYRLSPVPPGVTLVCRIVVETGGLLRLVEGRLRRDLDGKLARTLDAFRDLMQRNPAE